MDAVPAGTHRGLALLAAHLSLPDDEAPTARERLAEALGPELAEKLVVALRPGRGGRRAA